MSRCTHENWPTLEIMSALGHNADPKGSLDHYLSGVANPQGSLPESRTEKEESLSRTELRMTYDVVNSSHISTVLKRRSS